MSEAAGAGDGAVGAPSRRELREALAEYGRPHTALALSWLALDLLVWIALTAVTAAPVGWGWKLLSGLVAGVWIARLFIIGHDACHHALTRHRPLNRALGRLAFLPSLTPFSLWALGHNQAHHGFTNLRGRDGVWVPLSPEEFVALPRHRQWLERVYRSGWAPGLYYAVELWWKKLYFPRPGEVGGRRVEFVIDGWLVTVFSLVWLGALFVGAQQVGTWPPQAALTGWLLPLLVWHGLMGFVIYIHHTEPDVAWYEDSAAWAASRPYLSTTLHLRAPVLDALLHRILQHPAHHLDMTIPFYRLRAAQKRLQMVAPSYVQERQLTWGHYWRVAGQCKLYDYRARQWRPFSAHAATAVGHPTG
jgi:acyl-lipid omega-6 desaturase (Delta-12 desaturase)